MVFQLSINLQYQLVERVLLEFPPDVFRNGTVHCYTNYIKDPNY
jgi:hypothetical protein